MEYVDVYTEEGETTRESKSTDEVHRDGLWHRTTNVWIINSKKELLIQRRSPLKQANPGKWGAGSAGGHVATGDTSKAAAVREVAEEIGLVLGEDRLEYLFTAPRQQVHQEGTFISNHHDDLYLVRREIDLKELKLQAEEVSEVKWIRFTELEEAIKQNPDEFVAHPGYPRLFEILHQRFS